MPRSGAAWRSIRTGLAGVGIAFVATIAGAQSPPVLARLDTLAAARDTARAKAVVDSVLADTDPSAAVYPDALYWRGVLVGLPAGRTDLLRLIVEFPLHPRVSDALYLLAHNDLAKGDREAAAARLERITRDFAGSAVGPDAAIELAHLRLEQGSLAAACVAFDSALAYIPDSKVESRNRVSYEARPCERLRAAEADSALASAEAAVRDSVARAASPRGGKTSSSRAVGERGRAISTPFAPPVAAHWAVQVAAYGVRADAGRLASRLKGLGYDARVAGDGPFRVRVGRFVKRTEAIAMVKKLKDAKFTAIVVNLEHP